MKSISSSEEIFILEQVKDTAPWIYLIDNGLNNSFCEQELQENNIFVGIIDYIEERR